jgi:hypothetical protein
VAGRLYQTLAPELMVHADSVADYLVSRGYTVAAEQQTVGHPYLATLTCVRQRTHLMIEVDSKLVITRLDAWSRYGHSCGRDTRVGVALPEEVQVSAADVKRLKDLGVGLYRCSEAETIEVFGAQDLAVNVQLPDPKSLHPKMMKLLGSVYDQFDRTQWREGFEEACQVVETQARKYLRTGMKTGRLTFVNKKGVALTEDQVEGMTLGDLAGTFRRITAPNYSDGLIGQVLAKINKDRVGVAHHKVKTSTESRLRRNVGRHMYSVIAALKELLGV